MMLRILALGMCLSGSLSSWSHGFCSLKQCEIEYPEEHSGYDQYYSKPTFDSELH